MPLSSSKPGLQTAPTFLSPCRASRRVNRTPADAYPNPLPSPLTMPAASGPSTRHPGFRQTWILGGDQRQSQRGHRIALPRRVDADATRPPCRLTRDRNRYRDRRCRSIGSCASLAVQQKAFAVRQDEKVRQPLALRREQRGPYRLRPGTAPATSLETRPCRKATRSSPSTARPFRSGSAAIFVMEER